MIDRIQEDILNQGTVVVKQPDVWSQARMTKFRKEFEDTMSPELVRFQDRLAAQIARSDSAALQSQTSLAGVLNPFAPNSNPTVISTTDQLVGAVRSVPGAAADPTTGQITGLPALPDPSKAPEASFTLLGQATTGVAKAPFSDLSVGLEPNIHLVEKADYINYLHRLRRVNLGDDNSDSAGYGLYLMRVPVSIMPGDKTKKGWGATVSMTMRHDFGPRFLPLTYRNLVINDLIDILGPNVHELIRSGQAEKYHVAVEKYLAAKKAAINKGQARGSASAGYNGPQQEDSFIQGQSAETRRSLKPAADELNAILKDLQNSTISQPVNRTGGRVYSIAPSDVKRVFVDQNLLNLAFAAQQALDLGNTKTKLPGHDVRKVRANDVRTYLRHELEAAYDLMDGRCRELPPILDDVASIEDLTDQVYCRKFEGPKGVEADSTEERNEFYTLYESFTHRLPGNLRFRPIGVLAWGIAIEAGLLNRQLQQDMRATKGDNNYVCPPEVQGMTFYTPNPPPEVVTAFQEYIKARWPMITFALEPVVDQQNIEDAFTRRRDLQLAVAFALSSGRISFRQAIQFTRQLQYEAQTIALNQTVTSFAHGSDTFGWKFSPRFQTPPEESNLRTVTNLLTRGGPGPDYGLKNSKIEPGQRELTAVVVMPSFVRGMRLDVSGDWYRLHDPDERKLHSARTIELGRRINEAKLALDAACKCGLYRPEDTERLRIKLHQLEAMLPMQTAFVKVPYENTLGGFALFTEGTTSLVPELVGYEGVEYLDTGKANDLLIYGKHFSIYENAVVVGGNSLLSEGSLAVTVPNSDSGNPALVGNTLTRFRDKDDNLIAIAKDGSTFAVKDVGTYDILSREVMRVHIPKDVETATREDGTKVIELYVSTPNGISNRLQIPAKVADAAASPPAAGTFTFPNPTLTVKADSKISDRKLVYTKFDSSNTQLVVQPNGLDLPPDKIDLFLTFALDSTPPSTLQTFKISDIAFDSDSGTYIATADQLQKQLTDKLLPLLDGLVPSELATKAAKVRRASGLTGYPPTIDAATTNALTLKINPIVDDSSIPGAARSPAPASSIRPAVASATRAATPRNQDSMARRTSLSAEKSDGEESASTNLSDNETSPPGALSLGDLPRLPATALVATPQVRGGTVGSQTRSGVNGTAPTPVASGTTPPVGATPNATNAAPRATIAPSPTVIFVPSQRQPTVNVTVPITNSIPAKTHGGLFHRRATAPGASASTVRGPLLERLMGQP